jgi:hypothetical protein
MNLDVLYIKQIYRYISVFGAHRTLYLSDLRGNKISFASGEVLAYEHNQNPGVSYRLHNVYNLLAGLISEEEKYDIADITDYLYTPDKLEITTQVKYIDVTIGGVKKIKLNIGKDLPKYLFLKSIEKNNPRIEVLSVTTEDPIFFRYAVRIKVDKDDSFTVVYSNYHTSFYIREK